MYKKILYLFYDYFLSQSIRVDKIFSMYIYFS